MKTFRYLSLMAAIVITNVCAFNIISPAKIQSSKFLTSAQSITNKNMYWRKSNNEHTYLQMTNGGSTLHKVPEDDDTAIPFMEVDGSAFIECYADSVAIINGVEYTIGSPCDHAVALCYFDEDEQLVPIELDEDLMDDVFNIAVRIVEEEFGDELSLERTPQTLTLVGELEEGEDDEDDEDDEDFMDDDEEDVEILLSFEHDDTEFCLVRLLDPVLLVGKAISEDDHRVQLLTEEEADEVMPIIEEMFINSQEDSILE